MQADFDREMRRDWVKLGAIIFGVMLVAAFVLSAAVLFASAIARADEPHMHSAEPALSWYPELKTARGTTCCSNNDCSLTAYCTTERGGEGIWIFNGTKRVCRTLPVDRIVAPPPGIVLDYDEVHACWSRDTSPDVAKVWCVVGGFGA